MASSTSKIISTIRTVKGSRSVGSRSAISLTTSAVRRLKEIMKEQPEMTGLRIGTRTRGCNGQSYVLSYAPSKEISDEHVQQDGINVFIDRKALMHIIGTEMDYVEDKLSSGFVFNNPNIKGTCGCGESFNV
ncbi:hypothetical protein HELRODRAFT_84168 [Helobdella robusta]|uniref:Iron-sulfur cluster assembly 1 homolog, mitochondrial n=1 Tax=Helobdella robusta TaxID=6412 RepID=T1G5F8_HELRO|nr:hypothetical protein HELRODRAFT_84168 [Helobdella robusta]ESN99506.1 hypothetical protein HELRODRAFT_84168 [Helobdella robusta]